MVGPHGLLDHPNNEQAAIFSSSIPASHGDTYA